MLIAQVSFCAFAGDYVSKAFWSQAVRVCLCPVTDRILKVCGHDILLNL